MASSPPALDVSGAGLGQPAIYAFNITPNDDADLLLLTRAIRAGGAGDLALKTFGGNIVIIPDLIAGETVIIRATRVYATDTTATGLVGYA